MIKLRHIAFTLLLLAGCAQGRIDESPLAAFVSSYPRLTLPWSLDSAAWAHRRPAGNIDTAEVARYLGLGGSGRYEAVGTLTTSRGVHLLITIYHGPEGGYNDLYWLHTIDGSGNLVDRHRLATFAGDAGFTTATSVMIDTALIVRGEDRLHYTGGEGGSGEEDDEITRFSWRVLPSGQIRDF